MNSPRNQTAAPFHPALTNPKVIRNVERKEFETPTDIQSLVLPAFIRGENILGLAPTGTGKTAAYVLPVLDGIGTDKALQTQALILTPTPELSHQVFGEVRYFSRKMDVTTIALYDEGYDDRHRARLRNRPAIVVADAESAYESERRGDLDVTGIKTLVIDEADVMLGPDHAEALDGLMKEFPRHHAYQSVLMGASLPNNMVGLVAPVVPGGTVYNAKYETPIDKVTHEVYEIDKKKKIELCAKLLRSIDSCIVFCYSASDAQWVSGALQRKGLASEAIHDEMTAQGRIEAVDRFRRKKTKVLVSAGPIERGIDVSHVTHVMHYDLPTSLDSCVHRVGRVGRAGRTGTSIYFVTPWDTWDSRLMFRLLSIQPKTIELPKGLTEFAPAASSEPGLEQILNGAQQELRHTFKRPALALSALRRNKNFHDPSEDLGQLGFIGRSVAKVALTDLITALSGRQTPAQVKELLGECNQPNRIEAAATKLHLAELANLDDRHGNSTYSQLALSFFSCMGAVFVDSGTTDSVREMINLTVSELGLPDWKFPEYEVPRAFDTPITAKARMQLEDALGHRFHDTGWLDNAVSCKLREDGTPIVGGGVSARGFAVKQLAVSDLLRRCFFDLSNRDILTMNAERSTIKLLWSSTRGGQISAALADCYDLPDVRDDEKLGRVLVGLIGAVYSDGGYQAAAELVEQLVPESEEWLANAEARKRASADLNELQEQMDLEGELLERRILSAANKNGYTPGKRDRSQPKLWNGPDHKANLAAELTTLGGAGAKYKVTRSEDSVRVTVHRGKTVLAAAVAGNQETAEQVAAQLALSALDNMNS